MTPFWPSGWRNEKRKSPLSKPHTKSEAICRIHHDGVSLTLVQDCMSIPVG